MHAPGFDGATQRTVRGQQAFLPDHFVEGARAHALGQRAQVIPINAQQIGAGEGSGAMSWHAAIVPRRVTTIPVVPAAGRQIKSVSTKVDTHQGGTG